MAALLWLAMNWCYGLVGVRERLARSSRRRTVSRGPCRWPGWALIAGPVWWWSLLLASCLFWVAVPARTVGVALLLMMATAGLLSVATLRISRRWPFGDECPVRDALSELRTRVQRVEATRTREVGLREYVHGMMRLAIGTLPILLVVAMAGSAEGARDGLIVLAAWFLPAGLSFFCLFFFVVFLAGVWIRGYSLREAMSRIVRSVGLASGAFMVLAVVGGGSVAALSATTEMPAVVPIRISLVPLVAHSLTVGALVGGLVGLLVEIPRVATVMGDMAVNGLGASGPLAPVVRLLTLPVAVAAFASTLMMDDQGLAPRAINETTSYEVFGWGLTAEPFQNVDQALLAQLLAPQVESALPSSGFAVGAAVVTSVIGSFVGAARLYRPGTAHAGDAPLPASAAGLKVNAHRSSTVG